MMLKVMLIACFIAGYKSDMYHENADYKYKMSVDTNKLNFPQQHSVDNKGPQEFVVTSYGGLRFKVADKQKALQVVTMFGTLTLVGFTFRSYDGNLRNLLEFNMNNRYLKKVYISCDLFDAPDTEALKKHAETHAFSMEPMTIEDVKTLMQQPSPKKKHIKLGVEWIVNLLSYARPPLIIPEREQGAWWYLSPPAVMNGEVLEELINLFLNMDPL